MKTATNANVVINVVFRTGPISKSPLMIGPLQYT